MSRELLKRVIDELGIINHSTGIVGWHLNGDVEPWDRTEFPGLMEEIQDELAKPEPEPVAFLKESLRYKGILLPCHPDDLGGFPVYTHPPRQQEPLSEEILKRLALETNPWNGVNFARAIERAHGIGGAE